MVSLSSVEDDGIGDELTVIWEIEPGARVLPTATLPQPVAGRFDDPNRLSAFLDAVRWGAITSADSRALQAPFRSGITIEDYQLDPVVRALRMPRVNLFVADDTGLGKTIEAGLVVQELLLRHRARTVMVVCPASLLIKWQDEMAEKFGLDFEIVDSDRVKELRRIRGRTANPFKIFPRTIVSIDWVKAERAMRMLDDLLPPGIPRYPRRFDLLIVDEAHQAAPSGRGRYATDSLRTKAIRRLAPHFEHRLFLSATPHNGYTESFTALLELLDPQRFARGIKPSPSVLHGSVVRRLKRELREQLPPNPDGSPRFPERRVEPIPVDYPDSERAVHADLQAYAESRRRQAKSASRRVAADFVTLLLKKRLFSSPAAFANTLETHMVTLAGKASARDRDDVPLDLLDAFDKLDQDWETDAALDDATSEALLTAARYGAELDGEQEALVSRMLKWARANRGRPDAKTARLIDWLNDVCRPIGDDGDRHWTDERVIVFTEYRDTQRFLEILFTAAGLGGDRLALLYGGMDSDERERIKAEFQHHPSLRPMRILLATDAASEGIDLQRHCHRLVHVEIPFSPSRLEQRNGRIDRHGQMHDPLIYHFVGSGWEDAKPGSIEADLEFLSRVAHKVETIRDDLGTAGAVLAGQVEEAMLGRRHTIDDTALEDRGKPARELARIERNLRDEVQRLHDRLDESVEELGLAPEAIQRVVDIGLELGRQAPLEPSTLKRGSSDPRPSGPVYDVPALTGSWARAAAGLHDPITGDRLPITFDHEVARNADDVVLAHLGHRLVAQSMRLLRSEIWSSGADGRLARVSASIASNADQPEVAVVAHARLVITGKDGKRLHEEVITAGGRVREGRFARYNVGQTSAALQAATGGLPSERIQAELTGLWGTIEGPLFAALESRAGERVESLARVLDEAADAEGAAIEAVLNQLRQSISEQLDALEDSDAAAQLRLFDEDERGQWERDLDALRRRIDEIPAEIEAEKGAIRDRYASPRPLLFPAAVTFVVPETIARRGLGAM